MYDYELPPGLLDFLLSRGYHVKSKLGEGQTSDVYEVEYKKEGVEQRRVIKVPKQNIARYSSPTTRWNISNGHTNEHEILILNKLSHPNIIQVHDAFRWNDSTIPVEEHYDGISLEDLVGMQGPIKDREKFKQRFTQIIDAMRWLNMEQGVLHRDLKPSNILVGRQTNHVKICDMQTAGKMEAIFDKVLPTRGATQYTSPDILNSIVEHKPSHCNVRSEIYAIGAVMFHSLTGEPLFDRKLLEYPDGTEVQLEGRVMGLALYENGKKVEKIDIAKHDKDLKKRLKLVPRPYRNLIRNCVSSTSRYDTFPDYQVYNELRKDFVAATRSDWSIDWRLIAGCFVSGCMFIGCLAKDLETVTKKHPVLPNPVLNTTVSAPIENLLPLASDDKAARLALRPYFLALQKNILDLHINFPQEANDSKIHELCEKYSFSKRLGLCLTRSILMHTTREETTFFGQRSHYFKRPHLHSSEYRLEDSLTPHSYVRAVEPDSTLRRDYYNQFSMAISYLKSLSGICDDVEELFTRYFANSDECLEAKAKAGSLSLFGSADRPGYLQQFEKTRRDLICTSIALAYITDGSGALNIRKLKAIQRSYGAFTSQEKGQ